MFDFLYVMMTWKWCCNKMAMLKCAFYKIDKKLIKKLLIETIKFLPLVSAKDKHTWRKLKNRRNVGKCKKLLKSILLYKRLK